MRLETHKHTHTHDVRAQCAGPKQAGHSPLRHPPHVSGRKGLRERGWMPRSPPHGGRGQTAGKPGNSERYHPGSASMRNGFGIRSCWVPCQARLEPGAVTAWNRIANCSVLGEVVWWSHEVQWWEGAALSPWQPCHCWRPYIVCVCIYAYIRIVNWCQIANAIWYSIMRVCVHGGGRGGGGLKEPIKHAPCAFTNHVKSR